MKPEKKIERLKVAVKKNSSKYSSNKSGSFRKKEIQTYSNLKLTLIC